jgi:hypothetical protein
MRREKGTLALVSATTDNWCTQVVLRKLYLKINKKIIFGRIYLKSGTNEVTEIENLLSIMYKVCPN